MAELSAQEKAKQAELEQRAAEADYQKALTQRRTERIRNGYDAVEQGDNKRRKAKVETEDEKDILKKRKQLKSINLTRNLIRNFTAAKTIDHQKRINVVGKGPSLKLNWDDTGNAKKWQDWFNKEFYTDCDSRDDTPFNEILACIMTALGTDGGQIIAFDNFTEKSDGRLLFWSVDQLCEVNQKEWDKQTTWMESRGKGRKRLRMTQDRGIVRDSIGRVRAYIVNPQPGKYVASMDEVTILPRETAVLVKRPWRINQLIPIPEYLPMVADMEDLYEMRLSELQTAKADSKNYGYAKSVAKEEDNELDQGNTPMSAVDDDNVSLEESSNVEEQNYERAETFCGGYFDYLDEGDEIHLYRPQRPNDKLAEFFDHCLYGAAASVGLANVHAKLQAKNNYTAFRGEMLMSWATFRVDQLFLEQRVCDWLIRRLFPWKARQAGWELPDGWRRNAEWGWPEMPILDPYKFYQAQQLGLKTAGVRFDQILGPEWREKFQEYSVQLDVARKLGLPLASFETAAGGVVEQSEDDNNTTEE